MRQAVSCAAGLVGVLVGVLGACAGKESAKAGSESAAPSPLTTPSAVSASPAPTPAPSSGSSSAPSSGTPADRDSTTPLAASPARLESPPATVPGHDFTATGRALFVVGACGTGPRPEGFSEAVIAKHCGALRKTQDTYRTSWVSVARAFFAEKVPATVPKKVVYPFAGGDLSTALTVYPDADEITTMSLEPAGDPRTLAVLNAASAPRAPAIGKAAVAGATAKPAATSAPRSPRALEAALGTVLSELRFLYTVNFSNTMNMIMAMRGGALPTQLIFGLSALEVHGYEIVSLRYFRLDEAGTIQYLTDADVAAAPAPTPGTAAARNRLFANAEVGFRKPGGRVQIYRHIQVNLDDAHIAKDRRVLAHLEAKGPVAGMTKAASYLLSWDDFSTMRGYLATHVEWMVSDATGIAPKWGKAAGYEYETYGAFGIPHIEAGTNIAKNWRDEFAAQPRRPLKFRFGYYDKTGVNHLVIMRRKS